MSERESIWSVSVETKTLYFRVFTTLFLVGMVLLIVREVQAGGAAFLVERILHVWESAAAVAIASAAMSLTGIETGGLVMLWREKLENVRAARREEGRVVGREEGREEREQEMRRELMAWFERLEEARREGRPFDEPPPFADSNGRA